MQKIELHPDRQNLLKGLAGAAVLAFVGLQFHGGTETTNYLAYILWLVAGVLAMQIGSSLITPKPSFVADADGFSVMGKAKRPWSEFQSVQVETIRMYLIPVGRWVTVRAGSTRIFAQKLQIKQSHLSGPAKQMADAISRAAAIARMGGFAPAAVDEVDAPKPVVPEFAAPAPRRPVQPVVKADRGPIQTSRGLFGRNRKVL